MFYMLAPLLLSPVITYGALLIAAAVIPAIFLIVKVYKADKLEKESPALIRNLIIMGALSAVLAGFEERILISVLNGYVPQNTVAYNVILFFGIVAFAEETSKYFLMKARTWKNPEFNCQFDGVVYAVVTSLGFAILENIKYVTAYGFTTAALRAFTAIPGHACFGVFMGIFYGIAKKQEFRNNSGGSTFFRILAILVPAFIHGAYDFIATMQTDTSTMVFFAFIAVLFIIAFNLVGKYSKDDDYIDTPDYTIE